MTDTLRALILGVVQGLAEFLPISSSGHLRLLQDGLGWSGFGLAFDTLLHVGTLVAVLIYFRTDIAHMMRSAFTRSAAHASDRRLAWLVIAATVPTGLIGLVGGDWFESVPLLYVGFGFLITSATLTLTDKLSTHSVHRAESLGWGSALLVGIAQGIAIMPGISRSGATMAAGLGNGLDREQAARFSFLLSVPIILLAALKQAFDVIGGSEPMPGMVASAVGFVASVITGYLAIAVLMRFIKRHSFALFAAYTAVLGLAVVVWQLVG